MIRRALNAGYEPVSILIEDRQTDPWIPELFSDYPTFPFIPQLPLFSLNLTGFALTRGLLCAMKRKPMPSVEEICKGKRRIAVLENVVNPTNIGAIFRSAAALGMDAVLLSSGCSDPFYRRAARVSMGTVFQDPVDLFSERGRSLRRRTYTPQSHGIQDCRHGIKGRFRLHR